MKRDDAIKVLQDLQKCTRDALKEQNGNNHQNINVPYPQEVVDCAITVAISYMRIKGAAICTRVCSMRIPKGGK